MTIVSLSNYLGINVYRNNDHLSFYHMLLLGFIVILSARLCCRKFPPTGLNYRGDPSKFSLGCSPLTLTRIGVLFCMRPPLDIFMHALSAWHVPFLVRPSFLEYSGWVGLAYDLLSIFKRL